MLKNIFRTLKKYSKEFHLRNDKKTNKIYDAKVVEIKEKILSDIKRAKEIITAEIKIAKVNKKMSYISGENEINKCNAELKATDNIMSALIDSKVI